MNDEGTGNDYGYVCNLPKYVRLVNGYLFTIPSHLIYHRILL